MKKIYLLPSLALLGLLTSCYDLDTQPMGSSITEDQRTEIFEKDPAAIEALASGIYANYNGFEMCVGDMIDFGYPSIMLQLDSRTADFISANANLYGWFSECAEYLDNTATDGYSIIRWRLPYNIIYTANQVLAQIPADTDDNSWKYYRAQAYGNRAFAYWFLAQIYQFNYANHKQSPCVPIITEQNMEEVAINGVPRASVEEVYQRILADIESGIALMNNNPAAVRADKRYIDTNVLYGLQARAYLCMEDFAKAAAAAQKVIDSGAFTPLTSSQAIVPGFIDLSADNWIWGINYEMEEAHGLYTLPGFLGSYCYGYASVGMWKCITDRLYNSISDSDPRKLWWIGPSGDSNAYYFTNADGNAADYLESTGFPTYAVTKFAPYDNVLGQQTNPADIPLMRIEEMYLILAEAQGRGGHIADGINTLTTFVNNYRWLNRSNPYTLDPGMTLKQFIDEIFFQREVEFWGEGMTYFDILRLNLDIDRKGTNWSDPEYDMMSYDFYIPAGSAVLLSQIPQSEIDNNKLLKDQNPTGEAGR